MRRFYNKKITTRIIIAIIIVLICMFTPIISWLGNSLGVVVTPVETGITAISNGIENIVGFWTRVSEVDSLNKELVEKIKLLEKQTADYERIKKQNDEYRELLGIKERYEDSDSVAATVVSRDSGNWFSLFSVNKGTLSGIGEEFPVYNADGLIGKTIVAGATWCKIESIIDPNHSVSGMVSRTGDLVQIDGDLKLMKNGLCRLTIFGDNADVIIGDIIITSGIGGVYPKGITIGTVREFRTNEEGTGTYAILKPAVDFQHITDVLIMKRSSDDFEFTANEE